MRYRYSTSRTTIYCTMVHADTLIKKRLFFNFNSGAGKTTLLNILNFRNQENLKINGDIKINGKNINWKIMALCSGYVQQEDAFIGTLKVKEHLTFLVRSV